MGSGSQSGVIANVNHHCCSALVLTPNFSMSPPQSVCCVGPMGLCPAHQTGQCRSCELPVATAALLGSVETSSENFFILLSPSHFTLPLLLLDRVTQGVVLEPWALKMSMEDAAFRSTHSNLNNLSILVPHVGEIFGPGPSG